MSQGLFEQLNLAEKVIAVAGAAGLAFTTFTANTIQNEVNAQKVQLDAQKAQLDEVAKRQELELQARKDSREAARQSNELTKTIFDEFVKAITDQTTPVPQRIDRLEGVLVLTYAIPEPRQQEGMGRAVQRAMERIRLPDDSPEAPRLAAAKFDAEELVVRASGEQRTVAAPPPAKPAVDSRIAWSNYDFDVFYCDDRPATEALRKEAEAVIALKALDPKANGRWRIRPLPAAVNARPGYQVNGYQIRYSSADEKPLADALQAQMSGPLKLPDVRVQATSFQTPWYVSVFLCPAG